MDVAARLQDAATIGPFFAVHTDASGPGWLPYKTLLEDEAALRERVTAARTLLAGRAGVPVEEIDERASASIQHLGTIARLVSPLLSVAVTNGLAPGVTATNLHWRPLAGGRVEFAMLPTDSASLDSVLGAIVDPLSAVYAATWHISPQILRGNVASALAGAAKMLRQARPQFGVSGENVVRDRLARPPLIASGTWPDGGHFRRNNCCLFYRIPGGGTCGDCVLT